MVLAALAISLERLNNAIFPILIGCRGAHKPKLRHPAIFSIAQPNLPCYNPHTIREW